MPPINSKKIKINGKEIELYYISTLAEALGRSTQTVRKWEISGVLPKTMFKDKNGRRMYSDEQINIIVNVAEECQIKQGLTIANTSFSARVHRRINELNQTYTNGGN